MSLQRMTVIKCDFSTCPAQYEYIGRGSSNAALTEAADAGWVNSAIWNLCPEHATVKEVVRVAEWEKPL